MAGWVTVLIDSYLIFPEVWEHTGLIHKHGHTERSGRASIREMDVCRTHKMKGGCFSRGLVMPENGLWWNGWWIVCLWVMNDRAPSELCNYLLFLHPSLSFPCRPPPQRVWVAGWGSCWQRQVPPQIPLPFTMTTLTWRRPLTSYSWLSSPSGMFWKPPSVYIGTQNGWRSTISRPVLENGSGWWSVMAPLLVAHYVVLVAYGLTAIMSDSRNTASQHLMV